MRAALLPQLRSAKHSLVPPTLWYVCALQPDFDFESGLMAFISNMYWCSPCTFECLFPCLGVCVCVCVSSAHPQHANTHTHTTVQKLKSEEHKTLLYSLQLRRSFGGMACDLRCDFLEIGHAMQAKGCAHACVSVSLCVNAFFFFAVCQFFEGALSTLQPPSPFLCALRVLRGAMIFPMCCKKSISQLDKIKNQCIFYILSIKHLERERS